MSNFDPRQLRGKARFMESKAGAPTGVDIGRLQQHRLRRLQQELRVMECDACLLFDAVNIRYASGARNMQIFTSRNPAARYLYVPAQGENVLFEFPGCAHLAEGALVGEVRPAITASYVAAAQRQEEMCKRWGAEMDDLLRKNGCGRRLAMEAATPLHILEMQRRGYEVVDAQAAVEKARAKKSEEEIACVKHSLRAAEAGVELMRGGIRPGMSENELWSLLHQSVIAAGGDYIETRLLSSGAKTYPWFQECGDKTINNGELVAMDTDIVGPFGYYADFSRTFYAGTGKPTPAQRKLYALAREQIRRNINLLRPGASFREIAERAWKIPDDYMKTRYFVLAHGVGMTGEYPYILHAADFAASGYDGVLEPMTTLCAESYIGSGKEGEGVKLEEQVLITESGCEILSQFPFEEDLSPREI